MRILVLETAMKGCGAGIYDTECGMLASRVTDAEYGQAEILMPMVQEVLAEAQLTYQDMGRIAVTHGPGAFTGLRVGIAAAKALALALNIPAIGVCTFDAVLRTASERIKDADTIGILLDTKRTDYYFCLFDGKTMKAQEEARVASSSDIAEILKHKRNVILIGDAVQRYVREYGEVPYIEILQPSLHTLGILASAHHGDVNLAPVYIRPPDVSKP